MNKPVRPTSGKARYLLYTKVAHVTRLWRLPPKFGCKPCTAAAGMTKAVLLISREFATFFYKKNFLTVYIRLYVTTNTIESG
jgi:hypothetical protein